jgi:hypothetical protein
MRHVATRVPSPWYCRSYRQSRSAAPGLVRARPIQPPWSIGTGEIAPASHPVHRGWACGSMRSRRYAPAMRHTNRTRSAPEPLAALNAPTWLAVRSAVGFVVDATELAPGADLRSMLTAAREARISCRPSDRELTLASRTATYPHDPIRTFDFAGSGPATAESSRTAKRRRLA